MRRAMLPRRSQNVRSGRSQASWARRRTDPVATVAPGGSDSANLDNAVELLALTGRSLPHVLSMLIPEAWDTDPTMPEDVRAFYEFHASLMEPWDGPAAVAFTDGRVIGAKLDRNGLRPGRYFVTNDGLIVMASEAGVLPVKPEGVRLKGRLEPGRMLLVDTEQKRLISDEEIKKQLAARRPYVQWLRENQITLDHLPNPPHVKPTDHKTILFRQRAFGRSAVERWRGLYGVDFRPLLDVASQVPVYSVAEGEVVAAWPQAGPPAVLASVDLTTFEAASVRAVADLVVDPPGPVNAIAVTFRAHLHDGIAHTLDPWTWPSSSWATSVWTLPEAVDVGPKSVLRASYHRRAAGKPDGLTVEVADRGAG